MSRKDRHNLKRLSTLVAIVFSALLAALGVAGFQRTQDSTQLLLFLGIAVLGFFVVQLLFYGVGRLLDSLDNERDQGD